MEAFFCGLSKLNFFFEISCDFTVKKQFKNDNNSFFTHFLRVTFSSFVIKFTSCKFYLKMHLNGVFSIHRW